MTTEIHFLMVHGGGYAGTDSAWADSWKDAISKAIRQQGIDITISFSTVMYDALFERSKIGDKAVVEAIRRLTTSGLSHDIDDPLMPCRALDDAIRRAAGMIAQWAVDETLRSETCDLIRQAIRLNDPAVICAHSLGSLIAYDLFIREGATVKDRTFISFGSQIGHPFVRSLFGGRITPLPSAVRWHHLYNREDSVFTAPIRMNAANFEQVDMHFAISGIPDHDPREYLSHANTFEHVWKPMCGAETKMAVRAKELWRSSLAKPERRALLVGINEYPNPADRLEGCVNDVFRMSEVLQEGGVRPENIRVVLNHRATAEGIRDRLEWLLDGICPNSIRIFYYSGHGAQIPNYGEEDEIDHADECLVPYDFDWTPKRAIIDDWFCEYYSQLPYETEFIAIFDCCHSGGMVKNGAVKMRGLSPPDDMRHRSMMWDTKKQMWLPRKMKLGAKELVGNGKEKAIYVGESGAVKRLGRSVSLWSPSAVQFEKRKKEYGHHGPYMPILLQACREDQYSCEYRHGATSFGAFTYSLTEILRQRPRKNRRITFDVLVKKTTDRIQSLRYDQTPVLLRPKSKSEAAVPF